jgi:hypothetical protein
MVQQKGSRDVFFHSSFINQARGDFFASYLNGKKTKNPGKIGVFCLWSWRESNPRANKEDKSFLHAYPVINFRSAAGKGQPTTDLDA